ncbi:MAG: lysophospholipase [Candidatus Obscuribacterales bacterium]|nr:lysophospholipase [Candidatus Obscuribacterales bacterium]
MRQLVVACRSFSARLLSLFVATFLLFASSQTGFAQSQVVEDFDSTLFQDMHLPVYTWMLTNSSPKAIVVALHGGCLHGRSFRTLGQAMAEKNVMLVSLDMRGYGKWVHEGFGTSEDKRFNYAKSEADSVAIIQRLHEYFPNVPVFVLGESLGANMAEKLLADAPDLVAGGVLINPYVKPHLFFHPYMLVTFARGLTSPHGGLSVAPYLKNRLSDDRKQALAQINDPLSRNNQSIVDLFQSLFFNMKGRKSVASIPSDEPVLFVVGKKDRLCNPKSTIKQYGNMLNSDKTLVLLQDKGHLLVETTEIEPGIIDVLNFWLDAHLQ